MRKVFDKIMQVGIKLCLLTGVAFTFAACYGPAPDPERWPQNAPEYQQEQEELEAKLNGANGANGDAAKPLNGANDANDERSESI